ncbi:FMN-dependent dehydrogenase [Coniochaeta sp. PMI_546]|nr:FMN-dependent dehydrogenase [Coniochaeta sp. PMI_546]
MASLIQAHEVAAHKTANDLWTVVDGEVYDLTDFALEHPGGLDVLLRYAGRDATAAYAAVHSASLIKNTLPTSKRVGTLDQSTVPSSWSSPTASAPSQISPERPPLDSLISSHDFAAVARTTFAAKTRAFVTSAATDLHTYHRNNRAYADIGLRPRVLTDVSNVSIRTSILGHPVSSPIFASPTSLGKTVHPEGEKELARACSSLGIAQAVSTSASYPLDEIMSCVPASSDGPKRIPVFFQLYVDKNRSKSEALLRRAGELGISGLILTVDAPVPGKREADERVRVSSDTSVASPMTGASATNDAKGGALGRVMGKYIDPSVSWRDIQWLRRHLPPGTPIILKGIQTAADAMMAVDAGVDVVMVSNHGGRSLDTAPATILVLLELQRCCPEVFDKVEVWIDGGIMRGTDVFKALCLGAQAVGIGRGMLYGLNYGEEGVKRYVESESYLEIWCAASLTDMLLLSSSE